MPERLVGLIHRVRSHFATGHRLDCRLLVPSQPQ